ncbi:hypothetical protein AGMMS49579_01350 [Spirochaetia bacterium]|nr:hypothetical protein AGMMS49579_01350 [Spirochaetia bacterium]
MLSKKEQLKCLFTLKRLGYSIKDREFIIRNALNMDNVYYYILGYNIDISIDFLNQNNIKEEEEIEYLECPPIIEEGVLKCKCGSSKVYSFSKQTRRCDESTTVFALCYVCKNKWIY